MDLQGSVIRPRLCQPWKPMHKGLCSFTILNTGWVGTFWEGGYQEVHACLSSLPGGTAAHTIFLNPFMLIQCHVDNSSLKNLDAWTAALTLKRSTAD
jgi:hypothetical protein